MRSIFRSFAIDAFSETSVGKIAYGSVVALAEKVGLPNNLLLVLACLFLALIAGAVIRLALLKGVSAEKRKQRIGSLISWWVLALLLAACVLLGRAAAVLFVGLASLQGIREFLRLTSSRHEDYGIRTMAYATVPLHYILVYSGWYEIVSWAFIPVCAFLLLAVRVILAGKTAGYLQAVTTVSWGLIITVYCLSHAAMLFTLPATSNPVGGNAGWFLYLLLLTEANDIFQALWGRKFGKRKVVPNISPNKTWEGLILGVLSTIVLAIVLAPLLTPLANRPVSTPDKIELFLPWLVPAFVGFFISIAGFFGDVNMSAVKRDVGVKDSGTLIPGQGGILDRIDSLTFAAPAFFYYVLIFHG